MASSVSRYRIPTTASTAQAYMLGFFSFREKIDEADNPYPFGTEDYWQWRRGWYGAKKESRPPWWKNLEIWGAVAIGLYALLYMLASVMQSVEPSFSALLMLAYAAMSVVLRLSDKPVPSFIPRPLFRQMAEQEGKQQDEQSA